MLCPLWLCGDRQSDHQPDQLCVLYLCEYQCPYKGGLRGQVDFVRLDKVDGVPYIQSDLRILLTYSSDYDVWREHQFMLSFSDISYPSVLVHGTCSICHGPTEHQTV